MENFIIWASLCAPDRSQDVHLQFSLMKHVTFQVISQEKVELLTESCPCGCVGFARTSREGGHCGGWDEYVLDLRIRVPCLCKLGNQFITKNCIGGAHRGTVDWPIASGNVA